MRVGNLTDGRATVTAVQADDGRWYPAGPDGASVLDLLLDPGSAAYDGKQPLPSDYRPAVPFRPPRNVMCLGKNYRLHAEEFAVYSADHETVPEHPIVFTKAPEALCGATDVIAVPQELGGALDYEVELGVVIGRGGAKIESGAALSHVAGYTIVNDVTARDVQERHRQWFLGKSLPRTTPIGPVVVTPDELPDLERRKISCWIDRDLRQSAVLGDMIVGVPETIVAISALVPLEPGDVISMGTPSGVGIGFTPPRFLRDGETIACQIEGIGELRNLVRIFDAGERAEAR